MYKHILIATDGSEVGLRAVSQGLALAKATGAKVTAVKVTGMWSAYDIIGDKNPASKIQQFEEMAAAQAKHILDDVAAQAAKAGVACETVHVRDRPPADGIMAVAKDKGADLICMGSHGRRGLDRLLLGSQAHEVLTHAGISVLICR